MAFPTLTPEELAQIESERDAEIGVRDLFLNLVPAKTARAAELAIVDGSFKKFFDYYNDGIIVQYDIERRALDGKYIAAPIVEADILEPANLNLAQRTTPSLPVTDIIRVPEFDGGPLVQDPIFEGQHILDQADAEDAIVNGYSGTSPTVTATSFTNSALTSSSTTLDVLDATGPMSYSIGDVFVVHDGGTNVAVVEVTGVTDNAGGDPPYDFTLDIDLLVPPIGTIVSSSSIIASFTGFNNTERTNKIATDPDLQPLMDGLIANIEAALNLRIARLAEQLVPLNANQDPDAVAEIATTIGLVNTSDSFIDTYLLTTIVSDTGLSSLATERGTRTAEIATRIAQITANYTSQSENYFDRRYNTGNDRANTSRGTLRLQKNAESGATNAADRAASSQDAIDAYNALLGE